MWYSGRLALRRHPGLVIETRDIKVPNERCGEEIQLVRSSLSSYRRASLGVDMRPGRDNAQLHSGD